jgi:uncharacterized membrane protein YhaH (DUF805 family)
MEPSNPYRTPSTDVRAPSAGGVDLTGPFDPKGRFGRLSYIAWAVAISFALNLVELVLGAGLGLAGVKPEAGGPGGGLIMAITLLLSLAAVVATVLFFIRRLHDIDLSGWWALLGLVPIVNVLFGVFALVKPGTQGPNRFGPPRETKDWERVVGIIGVVLIVLTGLMLVVALIAVVTNPDLMQQWQQAMSSP